MNTTIPTISKDYFEKVKLFSTKFIEFINSLKSNQLCREIHRISTSKLSFEQSIQLAFILDVYKCFKLSTNFVESNQNELFALLYLLGRGNGINIIDHQDIHFLYDTDLLNEYQKLQDSYRDRIEADLKSDESLFTLSNFLMHADKNLQVEYLKNLYQFSSIVIKADGKVTLREEEALKRIMKLSESDNNHLSHTSNIKPKETENTPLNEILTELDALIGLTAVKEQVKQLINFIRIQKARESAGLKNTSVSYHVVFTGNPGTGKTTVARIISRIYKQLGVVTKGHLIETDRSGLIGEFVGHTAKKVNSVVDSALDGVLFIDEAYAIVNQGQDDFGKEAVNTLIKRIEDDRERLVVILAGYTSEMNQFIETNPGFKSRFNRYIEFPDYSSEELLAIFLSLCDKLDYSLTARARVKLSLYFKTAYAERNGSFGNGRFVRNTFEKTLESQANRIASVPNLHLETLTTIEAEDIP